MWFDSHCHLDLPGFDAPPAEVWAEARKGGISRVFVPGTDPSDWATSVVSSLGGVSTGIGLHPFTLERWSEAGSLDQLEAALARLESGAASGEHVAIGECGWDKPLARRCSALSLARQTAIVERHLRLAIDLHLPVVLHVVQAHGLALETLQRYPLPRGGIIHCFSGNAELVSAYCRMGFALGYGTQLARSNADKAIAALRVTPRERVVLETDAPLPARRGRLPNSPLALLDVAHIVSRVMGWPLEEVAQLTFANAARIFRERPVSSGPV